MFFFQQAYMWYRSQWWSHSWSGQKQSQLVNSPNSLPKWMSDLWTMQNQSTVQDLKKNTFFQSCEWCGGLADPTHKCPALSINRNQPAQPQLLECRAFEDKKRSSAKDTEDAVDGPDCWTQRGSLCTIPLKPRTIGLQWSIWQILYIICWIKYYLIHFMKGAMKPFCVIVCGFVTVYVNKTNM